MTDEIVVGIDLGTTNSSIAVLDGDKPTVLLHEDDGLVPSCVGLDAEGSIIVGQQARNQAVVFPDRTVLSVKRRMGTSESLALGGSEYSPQQISSFILKSLVDRAERVLEREVSRAVITVPAYFTDVQRKATKEAGEMAGLAVERIINEPTAASLAYTAGSKDAAKLLVYDLGGGTFDVSVVNIEQGVVEVLATTGNNRLGGDDFDALIVERLNKHLVSESGDRSLSTNRQVQARLLRAAEEAKCKLSNQPYVTIAEDNLAIVDGKPVNLTYELNRLEFETDIQDLLNNTLQDVSKALTDAKLRSQDLDRVLLVGGSTRIPLVAKLLKKHVGHTPHGEVDPDRCVALGAAIQGGMEAGMAVSSVLVDITPYTFGTRALGTLDGVQSEHKFVPIIPRNSKLPATKSERFTTIFPDQQVVEVQVYQGEDSDVRNNTLLYSVKFEGLNKNYNAFYDGVLFTYTLNLDGILEFTCRERVTGREITGRVEDALAARPGGAEDPLGPAPGSAPGAPGASDAQEDAGDSTAQLLKRAQAALSKAPESDLAEIQRLIRQLRSASKSGNQSRADDLAGELAELLFFIE